MKKVLFIGITDYDLKSEDLSLRTKFVGLSKICHVFVVARGEVGQYNKYGACFSLRAKRFLPIWLFITFFDCWSLIRTKKIDLIIAQSPLFEGFLGGILKFVTGKKLVVEIHGDWIESPFLYHRIPLESIVRRLFILCGRFSLWRADRVRVISVFTRELARKYGGDRPIVQFPTFFDVDEYLQETEIGWEPIVLYVGVLYRLKGVHFLIEAMSRISKKHPFARLVLVGDGPYRPELEAQVQKLSLGNVTFFGRLPASGVRRVMSQCSLLVLPSLSEGLGRVLIEASALGKPLIGSRVGGIPEIIQDEVNGYLIAPGDIQALATKIDFLLTNLEIAKRMGGRGRDKAKSYKTSLYFHSYGNLLEEL